MILVLGNAPMVSMALTGSYVGKLPAPRVPVWGGEGRQSIPEGMREDQDEAEFHL
jgi:hypothetical protein